MTPVTKQMLINLLLPIVTGIVVRWFSKRYPSVWAKFITAGVPEDIDSLVIDVSTKAGREGIVRQRVSDYAQERGVPLTETQLDTVMTELALCWKAGVKFAAKVAK